MPIHALSRYRCHFAHYIFVRQLLFVILYEIGFFFEKFDIKHFIQINLIGLFKHHYTEEGKLNQFYPEAIEVSCICFRA